MFCRMSPAAWRKQQNLSLARLARRLGIPGRNPARTLQRWENGERQPPLSIIAEYQRISGNKVTLKSWTSIVRDRPPAPVPPQSEGAAA